MEAIKILVKRKTLTEIMTRRPMCFISASASLKEKVAV